MNKFIFNIVLESADICNLVADAAKLTDLVDRGSRIVFTGRRNMGKTSLVMAKVIPSYRARHAEGLVVVVDLMGVRSLGQISRRLQLAFERGMSQVHPTRTYLQKMANTLRQIRPTMSIDALTGAPEFSLGLASDGESIDFSAIIAQIGVFHREHAALLVMDEFQDIAEIPEAEALFRAALQYLPSDMPVLIMGSKKHILANIFAAPGAPLAGWGQQIEIATITVNDYVPYINERLKSVGVYVDQNVTAELLKLMSNNPEAINIIGDWWQRHRTGAGLLTGNDIYLAIAGVVRERSSLYGEYLSQFTAKEETVLTAIAQCQPLKAPQSADFRAKVRMSPGGLGPLTKRLEDRAVVYRTEEGLIIADPLLAAWLRTR